MKKVQLLVITGLMALALAIAGCSGCGGTALPDSPDGTAKVVLEQLDAKNPGIVWVALPKSYQTDINGLVQEFAGKMDKELYDKAFVIAGKVTEVAKAKKEFILGNQMAAQMVGENKDEVSKNWDGFVALLDIVANSDIKTLDSLKSFDGGKCLNGLVKDLYVQADKLKDLKMFKEATDEMPKSFKEIKVEKIKGDDKTATIKVTAKDETEEIEMVKVEERWVPKDMADGWKDAIKEAKEGLAEMSGEEMTKNKPQVLAMMAMVESVVDQLKEAKSQEEFDKVVMGLAQGGLF